MIASNHDRRTDQFPSVRPRDQDVAIHRSGTVARVKVRWHCFAFMGPKFTPRNRTYLENRKIISFCRTLQSFDASSGDDAHQNSANS